MSFFGFLDYVPVVGTVKNTVEAAVAIVDGDPRRVAEKLTSAVVGGTLDVMTLGAGSALFKVGAKEGVKIAAKKGVQITAEKVACNVGGRMVFGGISRHDRNNVTHEVLANRRFQNRFLWDQDNDDDEERRNNQNQRPSKRGEHVINNNVLNVYRDIVRTFVNDVMGDDLTTMIESGRLSTNSSVVTLINHPIPDERLENFIRSTTVSVDGSYIDTNAASYGREIRTLREVIVSYMETIYDGFLNQDHGRVPGLERNVRDSVEDFIAGNYFVDEQALKLWLSKSGNSKQKFEKARQEVIKMFRRLKYDGNDCMVITWVTELFQARRRR